MRLLARLLHVAAWIYVAACAIALGIGAVGVFGSPSEPLAMVFAITLALPWSMVIGSPAGTHGPSASLVLLVLFMALNTAVLGVLARGAARRARG